MREEAELLIDGADAELDGVARIANEIVLPSSAIEPWSGGVAPARIFISVDFPAPFSPQTASTRPASIANDTSLSAGLPS